MNKLGTIIDLPSEIRELYVKYDFKFFLDKVEKEQYNQNELIDSYNETKSRLSSEIKKNKKQTLFHVDGAVRKMHSGGLLPSLFELDETRKLTGFDFAEYRNNWAYFDIWKRFEKRKIIRRKISKSVLFLGAVLAYILTVIKIIEFIKY